MTNDRLLRLQTIAPMKHVVMELGGTATAKPGKDHVRWFHLEGMLGGLASGSVTPTRAKPSGWGESVHLGQLPTFDVHLNYPWQQRESATSSLVSLVLRLVDDDRFESGLLADPELSALFMWTPQGMVLFETDDSELTDANSREVADNYLLLAEELERQNGEHGPAIAAQITVPFVY